MAENKQVILNLLVPVLQQTSNLADLESLEYLEEREFVKATFTSGSTKMANVHMDSGTSMIRDVIAQII